MDHASIDSALIHTTLASIAILGFILFDTSIAGMLLKKFTITINSLYKTFQKLIVFTVRIWLLLVDVRNYTRFVNRYSRSIGRDCTY